jgi:hypothetical protein
MKRGIESAYKDDNKVILKSVARLSKLSIIHGENACNAHFRAKLPFLVFFTSLGKRRRKYKVVGTSNR